MFKKICGNCGEKTSDRNKFCPGCGNSMSRKSEDLGMLGNNDYTSAEEIRFPKGFNMIFNSLLKNLDKQFKELDGDSGENIMETKRFQRRPKINRGGISISISTSGNKSPEIKVGSFGNVPKFKQQEQEIKKQIKEIPSKTLSQKSLKKISKLPKEEPSTNIRRLADRVIYEIDIPGVKSIRDVSIVKLENSIEIKALTKDKVYIKLIPINLPISDYKLSKGKLILELEAKG